MTFPFNPTDIEVTRGCGFSSENSDSNSVNDYGGLKFGGAKSDELSMSFILDTSEPDVMSAKYATQMMMPIIMSTPSMAPAKTAKAIPYFGGNVNTDSVTSILDVINMMTKFSDDDRKKKKKDAAAVIIQDWCSLHGVIKSSSVVRLKNFHSRYCCLIQMEHQREQKLV